MKYGLLTLGLLGLTACGAADSDGDGLSNKEEKEWGTDPENGDSDADGLSDGDEVHEYGSDPLLVDSDEDTYLDGDEVALGFDPANAESRIYQGNWPYRSDKEELKSKKLTATPVQMGQQFGRLQAVDQYGDIVDIYDFANTEGKMIVIDVSAQWCPPCQAVASWLDNDPSIAPDYDESFPKIRKAVKNGDLIWITILGEDDNYDPPKKKTSTQWHREFPHPMIPVLSDTSQKSLGHVALGSWPTMLVLDENLEVIRTPASEDYDPETEAAWPKTMEWLGTQL